MPNLVGVRLLAQAGVVCLAFNAQQRHAQAHDSLLAHGVAWRGDGASADFGARTNRGIIFKAEASARLLCHEAIGAHPSERLPLVSVTDGWLVATSGGVVHLDSAGCPDESRARLDAGAVQDLIADPREPGRLYAVTADSNVGSGLFVSDDEGSEFHSLLQLAARQFYNSVVVQAADEPKLYLSGASLDAETGVIQHFIDVYPRPGEPVRRTISLSGAETQVRMLAADEARVFARVVGALDGSTPDRLLLSEDGGDSWESLLSVAGIGQLSFSEDGKSLWLATAEGLYFSDFGELFQRQDLIWNPSCVETRGDELVLCDALGIHVATDRAKSEPLMFFGEVTSPVSCDGSGQPLPECVEQWADFSSELSALPTSRPHVEMDGGVGRGRDAGGDSDSEPQAATTSASTGCSVAPGSRLSGAGLLGWSSTIAALAWIARKRRAARIGVVVRR